MLDIYQSAGVLPLDVSRLAVDFAVGGCLKWLCGGPGNAFLYVRPDLAHLKPRLTGWMAHAEPFAFEPPPIRYAEGPFRFLNGTPPIPCLYAAVEGLNNKIRVIQRRAYGLRDEEYLRLKILTCMLPPF